MYKLAYVMPLKAIELLATDMYKLAYVLPLKLLNY